jgi:hypothetical protein
MAMHVSISSSAKSNLPTAPAYTPRRSPSNLETNSTALILGAPDTVPAGKIERNASNLKPNSHYGKRLKREFHRTHLFFPSRKRPDTWLVRWITWLNFSNRMSSSTLTVLGWQTLLTSFRARSTSIICSARSLADANSCAPSSASSVCISIRE